MSGTTREEPNGEPRLMTSIDGQSARLLVHIEPIEEPDDGPTEGCRPEQASPPDSSGLAE